MLKRESEGRKATGMVKSDDEGAQEEVAASTDRLLPGCTQQASSMASGVSSGLKTEPQAREGPNEHHGSFITNKRNREAAMNISAFCSSSGITLYLCRPHR